MAGVAAVIRRTALFLLLLMNHTAATARTWLVKLDGTGDAPTIQAAIDSSTSGDDILVDPGVYTWTNQGASGADMLRLKPDIVLHSSAGPMMTTLDAELHGRVIECDGPGTGFTIEGLLVQRGNGVPGGALHVAAAGTVTIRDCTFLNNHSISNGGAVWAGPALIENTRFFHNTGLGGDVQLAGGALFVGEATLEGCDFE